MATNQNKDENRRKIIIIEASDTFKINSGNAYHI